MLMQVQQEVLHENQSKWFGQNVFVGHVWYFKVTCLILTEVSQKEGRD